MERLHVLRHVRAKLHVFAGGRMDEPKGMGMKSLTGHVAQIGTGQASEGRADPLEALFPSSVYGVSEHGMAYVGEVDSNLMSSAGVKRKGKERKEGKRLDHPIAGHCRSTPNLGHRHPLSIYGMAANGGFNRTFGGGHVPPDKAQVPAGEGPMLQLAGKVPVRFVTLGDHEETRGIPI